VAEREINSTWRGRIEQKLDVLSDVIVQLARIEERQINHLADMKEIKAELNDHEERLRNIERICGRNSVTVGSIERVAWLLVTAAIGAFATFFE